MGRPERPLPKAVRQSSTREPGHKTAARAEHMAPHGVKPLQAKLSRCREPREAKISGRFVQGLVRH